MDRVGGVAGLIQDAVLSQPVRADAERLEHGTDHGRADRADIGGGLLADQQVRIAAARPALMSVEQPPAGQGGGDLIEEDDPVPVTVPDDQRARGQVEVGRLKPDQVGLGHGVDGDQGNDEPRRRAAGAVEEPGDAVGGQRLRKPGGGGQEMPRVGSRKMTRSWRSPRNRLRSATMRCWITGPCRASTASRMSWRVTSRSDVYWLAHSVSTGSR